MVQRYIEPTVAYYRTATMADNHAVREAACACIAELAAKLEYSAVQPYVPTLLDTLLSCFRDDSWPVRDGKIVHFICVTLSKQFFYIHIGRPSVL